MARRSLFAVLALALALPGAPARAAAPASPPSSRSAARSPAAASPGVAAPSSSSATPLGATAPSGTAGPGLTAADVDRALAAEWRKHHLTPGPPVDDAGYLRRVTLDLTGTIPRAEAVRAFLADPRPDKRARAVDALLASPAYARHFATIWDRLLLGRNPPGNLVDRVAFARWLYDQFARNRPWSELVTDLVTATGQNTLGGVRKNALGPVQAPEPDPQGVVHAAVNWQLRYDRQPGDLAGKLSRLFLGVQIQCAECHDHPSEKWKQDDFRALAATFVRTAVQPLEDKPKGLVRKVLLVDQPGLPYAVGPKAPAELRAIALTQPRALDGSDLASPTGRRRALAEWMVAPGNPYFARALVNRYWAHLVGRGFVEPIDDFRHANPPVAPDVLDRLAADFVAHKFDLGRLIRLICATRAYQLATVPGRPGEWDERLFVHHRMRPLSGEELYNALAAATGLEHALAGQPKLGELEQQLQNAFDFLFSVDEEAPPPADFAGSIQQALLFLNGALVNRAATAAPGLTLFGVLDFPADDAAKVSALYLRTLGREPSAAERHRFVAYVNAPREIVPETPAAAAAARANANAKLRKKDQKNPLAILDGAAAHLGPNQPTEQQQAYEDLFWALLNSTEFLFQH